MTVPEGSVLLGGYAAKQCPVRTHNDFAPLVPVQEWVAPPELQALFDAGRQYAAVVSGSGRYRLPLVDAGNGFTRSTAPPTRNYRLGCGTRRKSNAGMLSKSSGLQV